MIQLINQKKLEEHIALEDWEKRLVPLFLFKGTNAYRVRKMWNVAYAMFLSEAPKYRDGIKLVGGNDTGHFCGFHRPPELMGLRGIFTRLRGCQDLTNSISKSFTEYVEWVHPYPCTYVRVPLQDIHYKNGVTAWWRTRPKRRLKVFRLPDVRSDELQYPFFRGEKAEEPNLLMKIHAQIPRGVPHAIRGDLCQDLVVAVLSGELKIENIPDQLARFRTAANKFNPESGHRISLDQHICGMEDVLIGDRLDGTADHF